MVSFLPRAAAWRIRSVQSAAMGGRDGPSGQVVHCLSYTAVLFTFLPFGSVPLVVTVRLLPSAETTTRPVTVAFPSFLTVNCSVRSSIFLYDRASEVGSPVTG